MCAKKKEDKEQQPQSSEHKVPYFLNLASIASRASLSTLGTCLTLLQVGKYLNKTNQKAPSSLFIPIPIPHFQHPLFSRHLSHKAGAIPTTSPRAASASFIGK